METAKVLIIDDDELSYFSISLAARSEFFQILPQAKNSSVALSHIEEFKPSVILMDIRLEADLTSPKAEVEFKDGIELAHFINTKYQIPIIFVTGYSDYDTVSRSISKDFYGILPKPVDKVTLQTTLLSTLLRFKQDQEKRYHDNLVNTFFDHSMFGYFLAKLPEMRIDGEVTVSVVEEILNSTIVSKINIDLLNQLGYSEDEVIGGTISEIFNVNPKKILPLIEGIVQNKSYEGKVELQNKKNKAFTAEVFCKRVKFEGTGEQVLLGMIRDITKQVEAQTQLEMLATAIAKINEAVIVTNADLEDPGPEIIYVNDAACKMTGYKREELIGKTPRILQGPKTNRDILVKLKETLKKGESFSAKTVNYKKDGSTYNVEWNITPVKNDKNEVEYFVSNQRDVTEIMQLLEKLERNQEVLEAILNNSRVAKVLLTFKNEILFINQYAKKVFSIDEVIEPVSGIDFLSKVTNSAKQSIQNALEKADYDSVENHEMSLSINNEDRLFEFTCKKLGKSGSEEDVEYLITAFDVTEIRRANLELHQINKRLEEMVEERTSEYRIAKEEAIESARVKERFLANMSHEIRTPINGIRGMVHLLQDTLLNHTQLEYLDTIRISSDNLLVIINDILDIEKIEAGKIELEQTPFDILDIALNTQRLLNNKAVSKNIHLKTDTKQLEHNLLKGDSSRIQQIILNLVDNAIKFTSKGDVSVRFASKRLTDELIELTVDVRDSGIGMTQEKMAKIFNPFEQADASISRRFGGTGLGLSISKKLVEMMGGSITVNSIPNKGSEFVVKIPLISWQGELQKENKNKIEDLDFSGLHFLLVDDNKVNLLFLKRLLERWNCDVDIADSGMQALDLLRNKKYDLLFLDIQMPEMDGYEVSRFIRRDLRISDSVLPIVAITADVLSDSSKLCEEVGINDIVMKPFDPSDIKQTILKWLFSSSTEASNQEQVQHKSSLLDFRQVNELAGDDAEFKLNILNQFHQVMMATIDELPIAIKQKDIRQIRMLVHRIKPNAGYFGLNLIMADCKEMMIITEQNDTPYQHIEDLGSEICSSLLKVKDELELSISEIA